MINVAQGQWRRFSDADRMSAFSRGFNRSTQHFILVPIQEEWIQTIEVVERPTTAIGFEVLPKRWIVTVRTMLPGWVLSGHRSSNAGAADGNRFSSREAQSETRVNLSQATQSQRRI